MLPLVSIRATAVAALFAALALTATARAGVPSIHGPVGAHGGNAVVVAELHAAKSLLEKGDHDYKGHRAHAVHLITEAIHELHPHHKHTGGGKAMHAGSGKGVGKGAGGQKLKEPQQVSDAQLREAIGILTKAESQLGHHPKAAAHVQQAIGELNTALKIK
jgi:hypothetical protein